MNASHFINLFTNSRHPISTNSKLLRTHINLQQPQFLYSLRRRLTLETSAFQIFHGGHSTFINSFDKINFCHNLECLRRLEDMATNKTQRLIVYLAKGVILALSTISSTLSGGLDPIEVFCREGGGKVIAERLPFSNDGLERAYPGTESGLLS